jgi:hypothetical protein
LFRGIDSGISIWLVADDSGCDWDGASDDVISGVGIASAGGRSNECSLDCRWCEVGTLPAFAFCAVALLVNFTAGYWLARCGLRLPLTRRFERRGWRIPQLSAGDETMAILILRVTPGVPLCIQNYLLGLTGVKFARYLLLSLPAQAAYALASKSLSAIFPLRK